VLARVGPLDRPAELKRVPLLRSPLEPWRTWFAAAGLDWPEPREGVQYNDVGLLMEAAVAGQGAALGRRKLAQRWIDAGMLVPLFAIEARSPHAYWLLHAQASLQRAEVRAFVEWLRSLVQR